MFTKHFNNSFSLQTSDDAQLTLKLHLPFGLILMLFMAVSDHMNIWEISLTLGRQRRVSANGHLADGYTADRVLLYRYGPTHQQQTATETAKYCIDEIDFASNDEQQEAIDAYCMLTFCDYWDVGSPQPNSPDIQDQVRQVLDDIDEHGMALPY